jgi:hypothetical protein
MLCILYVIFVGTVLGWVGVLTERALPATAPRRWVWCGVIALSIVIPGLFRSHHSATLDATWVPLVAGPNQVVGTLWQAASALLIVWGVFSARRISRILRAQGSGTHPVLGPRVVGGVPVLVTEALGPATTGVWRQRVLVPRWVLALPAAQQRYVIQHEDEHRKAWDGRLLFLASLTLVLVPWNLALWWQLRRLSLAVETDCDRRVVRTLGDPRRYGALLLDVVRAGSRPPRLQPALLGGAGTLEHRLTLLLASPRRHAMHRVLAPALALVLLLLVLLVPHPVLAPASGAHAHSMTPPAAPPK